MRKLMIAAGLGAGVLSAGALAGAGSASAAEQFKAHDAPSSRILPMGEDDDDDGEWRGRSGGGGGGGSLPATGTDATGLAMLGALTLAAGGATYRVAMRRQPSR